MPLILPTAHPLTAAGRIFFTFSLKILTFSYMLFSTSIFDRFWSQLGPNLAPKSIPKPTQEPSKIDPKSHLIFDQFFDRFFIDFSSIFDPKINQKSIKNQSQNHPKSTSTKNKKHRFCIVIYSTFVPSAMLCCIQN